MSDFIIGHVTDSKEGPMDGVYAETKGTYTKFKGTGVFQKEKRILHQSESNGCRNQGQLADWYGKHQ